MKKIYPLKNSIKNYDWGSRSLMNALFGYKNPESKPQAELWMGTHPRGISIAIDKKVEIPLGKLILSNPINFLGERASKKFKRTLPFLFKVLTPEKALSIQAHPSKRQAEIGFKNENKHHAPIDNSVRNYHDDNHKPVLACALTDEFSVMCGFRPVGEIVKIFNEFAVPGLTRFVKILEKYKDDESSCLQKFFESISSLEGNQREQLVNCVVQFAYKHKNRGYIFRWVCKLYDFYDFDIGVVSPLYLNLFSLKKGQAVYFPPGQLYAYLEGAAVELIAKSDNVLHAGLTSKHINIPELVNILSFKPFMPDILEIQGKDGIYETPSTEFQLFRIKFGPDYFLNAKNPAQIVFCSTGRITLKVASGNDVSEKEQRLVLKRGDSVFIPYHSGGYIIQGRGELFFARIPF